MLIREVQLASIALYMSSDDIPDLLYAADKAGMRAVIEAAEDMSAVFPFTDGEIDYSVWVLDDGEAVGALDRFREFWRVTEDVGLFCDLGGWFDPAV